MRWSDGASADGRSRAAEAVKQAFIDGEFLIECPRDGCAGLLLSSQREFSHSDGTASRVVLRCTREPDEHEVTVSVEPYSAAEKAELKAAHRRAEQPACSRCWTPLESGTVEVSDQWADSASHEDGYCCPWCGLKWVPTGQAEVLPV